MKSFYFFATLACLSVFLFVGMQSSSAQAGSGGNFTPDPWEVRGGETTCPIINNAVPGNYKVHNDKGSPDVEVTVYNAAGEVVAGPIILGANETSAQMGVPLGGTVEVKGLGQGKKSKGNIVRFS